MGSGSVGEPVDNVVVDGPDEISNCTIRSAAALRSDDTASATEVHTARGGKTENRKPGNSSSIIVSVNGSKNCPAGKSLSNAEKIWGFRKDLGITYSGKDETMVKVVEELEAIDQNAKEREGDKIGFHEVSLL